MQIKKEPVLISVKRSDLYKVLETIEDQNTGSFIVPKSFALKINGKEALGINYSLYKKINEGESFKEIMIPIGLIVIDDNNKAHYQLEEDFKPKRILVN